MIDLTLTTEEQRQTARLLENREWFDKNIEAISSQHAGRVVAVHERAIVASANTAEELSDMVKGKYPPIEVLKIMVPAERVLVVPYPE